MIGHPVQHRIPLILRQPDDLKRAVCRKRAGLVVVVDPFARPREHPRRGIVVIHDEMRVGLVALERDADDHLPQRRAGQQQVELEFGDPRLRGSERVVKLLRVESELGIIEAARGAGEHHRRLPGHGFVALHDSR